MVGLMAHHLAHGRGWWLQLGRIGGVELRIHASWWLLVLGAIFAVRPGIAGPTAPPAEAWALAISFGLALAVVGLAHEVGHALVGARIGLEPVAVNAFALGAATIFRHSAPGPREKALSAIAGPAGSLVVALVAGGLGLLFPTGSSGIALFGFAFLNLAYAVLNLVPIYPQDGGHLLHALLWRIFGDELRTRRLTGRVGLGLAVVTVGLGVAVGVGLSLIAGSLLAVEGGFLVLASLRAASFG